MNHRKVRTTKGLTLKPYIQILDQTKNVRGKCVMYSVGSIEQFNLINIYGLKYHILI